jgi:hypothetical protein
MTWHQTEVVYGPQETRVYLYDLYRSPVSARGVQGQVIMRVRSNGTQFRYPLQHVPVERGQDFLVARVDLTRVQDGDMDVYYELAGLPNREAPTVKFAQVYSMTRPADATADRYPPTSPPSHQTSAQYSQASPPAKKSCH